MSGELVIEVIPDGSTGPAERPPRRFAQLRLAVLIAAVLVLVGGAVYGPGLVRDLGGRQLFSREASYAAWVSPDRALVLSPHATDPLSAEAIVLDVYSVAAATGRSTRIGTFRDLIGACAADERYLVCPLTDAVVAWRYA